jgi:hypothetical protein
MPTPPQAANTPVRTSTRCLSKVIRSRMPLSVNVGNGVVSGWSADGSRSCRQLPPNWMENGHYARYRPWLGPKWSSDETVSDWSVVGGPTHGSCLGPLSTFADQQLTTPLQMRWMAPAPGI